MEALIRETRMLCPERCLLLRGFFLTRGAARLRALTQDLLPAFHTESVGAVVPGVSLGDTNVVRRAGERLGRSNVCRSRVLRFGKPCVGLLTS